MTIHEKKRYKPSTREEYLAYRAGIRHTKKTIVREINRRLYRSKEGNFIIAASVHLEEMREFLIKNIIEPDIPKELRVTRGKSKEKT